MFEFLSNVYVAIALPKPPRLLLFKYTLFLASSQYFLSFQSQFLAMSKVISLSTRISKIPGIGPVTSDKLALLGLESVKDLIYILPRNWEDLTHLSQVSDLLPRSTKFTIKANLSSIKSFRSPAKRMTITQAIATDGSGSTNLVWFNQPYLAKSLQSDETYFITGQVIAGKRGLTITNPTVELASHSPIHSGRIIPTYASVGGLSTKILRRIFTKLIPSLEPIPDPLPENIIDDYNLISIDQAIRELHLPTTLTQLEQAKHRLAFDELLDVQLQVQTNKLFLSSTYALPIPQNIELVKSILSQLPYQLTARQKRALWDILQDLDQPTPTNRLLEGDVGSGKTIVATIAMLVTAKAGFQSALMVPTEVLAEQHFINISPLAQTLGITVSLITQSKTIGDTSADIIIGTHKLIQKTLDFPNLNLVIVDEQHRFGVKQREALKLAGTTQDRYPHFISLTATPIPRSLALTLFGDLDLSIIPSPPANRTPIKTLVISRKDRNTAYKTIAGQLNAGHQVFIVTPLITTSPKLTAQSVEAEEELIRQQFPNTSIGILHGKLSSETKAKVMEDFKSNKISILIATTVIEVGIDIPNATVMLIEGAERFGLAQLHQLRGRVGRSQFQSYCFVSPTEDDPEILERLELFSSTFDGFKLSELDLELRGPGSLRGTMQAGFVKFRLAEWNDPTQIQLAQTVARQLITHSPDLSAYPLLAQKLNANTAPIHSE